MRAGALLLGLALALLAERAEATLRVSLHALSPGADRAILSYDLEWVEVMLASGQTRLIVPPPTCSWNSADYAPDGSGFALTALCSGGLACEETRTGLWRSHPRWGTAHVATAKGRRWSHARWRADQSAVFVTETRVFTPRATGLNDLQTGRDCAAAPAAFLSVSPLSGRSAVLDFLPRGWAALSVLSAAEKQIFAALHVRDLGRDDTAAERALAAFCAKSDTQPGSTPSLCERGGGILHAIWDRETWHPLEGALLLPFKKRGRLRLSSDMQVKAAEICMPMFLGEGPLRPRCRLFVTGRGSARILDAPAGLFGDITLDATGRFAGALLTGQEQPDRRFDVFNVETGAVTSYAPLLALTPPWDETP